MGSQGVACAVRLWYGLCGKYVRLKSCPPRNKTNQYVTINQSVSIDIFWLMILIYRWFDDRCRIPHGSEQLDRIFHFQFYHLLYVCCAGGIRAGGIASCIVVFLSSVSMLSLFLLSCPLSMLFSEYFVVFIVPSGASLSLLSACSQGLLSHQMHA